MMLPQKIFNESSEKTMNLAIGENFSAFSNKLKSLQALWNKVAEKQGDSVELRLISPVLFRKTSPINISIIADNLNYFKDHYKEVYENNLDKALQIACLCGSQAIGEFLIKELKVDFNDKTYDFILGYTSSSLNDEWTLSLAKNMKNVRKDFPRDVYLLCRDIDTLDNIKDIFNNIQINNNTKKINL